jgi:hypothetical protein
MLINVFLWSFFLSQVYKNYYPENYNMAKYLLVSNFRLYIDSINGKLITAAYKLLYCYSVAQIQIYKIKNFVSPYLKEGQKYIKGKFADNENIKTVVSFYSHGDLIKTIEYSFHCNQVFISNITKPPEYDLVTIADMTTDIINVTVLNDIADSIVFNASDVKFLALECVYEDNQYNIELKTDKYNFYMSESLIDNKFIKYYLKNVLRCENPINIDKFSYTLNLIDHNVNCHELTELDHIIIGKDDYKLVKLSTTNTNDSTLEKDKDKDENEDVREDDNNIPQTKLRTFSDEKDWVLS